MNKWNYRVVKHRDDEEPSGFILGMHEVYYEEDKPVACTEKPAFVASDIAEFERILERMKEALQKPALDYDAFK